MNKNPDIGAFLFFLAFFLLLFFQFPQNGSLPGLIDSWWYVATFNQYANSIASVFSGGSNLSALFEVNPVVPPGEPAYGGALIYLFFKGVGFSDIWCLYFLVALVYSTSAFGCYLVSSHFVSSGYSRIFAGLVFSAAAFSLAHIDDQKVFCFFWGLLAFHFLIRHSKSGKPVHFLLSMLFLGIQVYFSSYAFLFSGIILAIYILTTLRTHNYLNLPNLGSVLFFVILILPIIYRFTLTDTMDHFESPFDVMVFTKLTVSLNPSDFFQRLPNNVIYGSTFRENPTWIYQLHCAWPGIVFIIMAITGFLYVKSQRILLTALFLVGLIIAMGPAMKIGDKLLYLPMYPVYKYMGPAEFIRIPLRAYLISMLALSIFAGRGMDLLIGKWNYPILILLSLSIVFILENVPFPFQKYPAKEYIEPSGKYYEYLLNKKEINILELPAAWYDKEFDYKISAPAREYIYMFWQTKHHHNIINSSGFIHPKRIKNQEWINKLDEAQFLDSLIIHNDLDLISWHPNMLMESEDYKNKIEFMLNSPLFKRVRKKDDLVLFEVN